VADVDVMQYRVGDVDAAVAASRTSTSHVPEHVGEASELTVATDAPAGLHPAVASSLHQNHIAYTGTVDAEVLRLAVVCDIKN